MHNTLQTHHTVHTAILLLHTIDIALSTVLNKQKCALHNFTHFPLRRWNTHSSLHTWNWDEGVTLSSTVHIKKRIKVLTWRTLHRSRINLPAEWWGVSKKLRKGSMAQPECWGAGFYCSTQALLVALAKQLYGPIRNCLWILGRAIRNRMCILGGLIRKPIRNSI